MGKGGGREGRRKKKVRQRPPKLGCVRRRDVTSSPRKGIVRANALPPGPCFSHYFRLVLCKRGTPTANRKPTDSKWGGTPLT